MTGPGAGSSATEAEGPPRPDGLRLLDLVGLIVGFGLAALLARSFWRDIDPRAGLEFGALAVLYAWAGLAMSGPFVLLLDPRNAAAPSRAPKTEPPSRFAGEELAWLGIGTYFVAATLFVAGIRDDEPPWQMNLAIQVIGAACLMIWFRTDRRERGRQTPRQPRWTRLAARVVLLTWPIAWVILLWLVW